MIKRKSDFYLDFYLTATVFLQEMSKKSFFIFFSHSRQDLRMYRWLRQRTNCRFMAVGYAVGHYPSGFCFYMPNTVLMAWAKEDKRLKQQGATKKDRPVMPGWN